MVDTLYITDLDGTLLNNNKHISKRSADILNGLIDKGIAISVASARSLIGIQMIHLGDVHFHIPMVLMNGVLLYDFVNKRILNSCSWDEQTASQVLNICIAGGKTPFLYRVENGRLDISFTTLTSKYERLFYQDRVAVLPQCFRHVEHYPINGVMYYSIQDGYKVLAPIYNRLKLLPDVDCVLYMDTYHEDNWYLEVFSSRAGKHNGLKRLRKRLDVRRVVAFGDNLNDLPMLKAADVACVVANGSKQVRDIADIIIDSNEQDGVAKYILQENIN